MSSRDRSKIIKSPWQKATEKQIDELTDDIRFLLEHQKKLYGFIGKLASNAAKNSRDRYEEISHEN